MKILFVFTAFVMHKLYILVHRMIEGHDFTRLWQNDFIRQRVDSVNILQSSDTVVGRFAGKHESHRTRIHRTLKFLSEFQCANCFIIYQWCNMFYMHVQSTAQVEQHLKFPLNYYISFNATNGLWNC